MATRGEIRAEFGIVTIEHPDIANKELTTAEANEYREFIKKFKEVTTDWNKEIDENIEKYCSKCKYYNTKDSTKKCDSWIHGSSYGVDCIYIAKAKGEDLTYYKNRRTIDF